MARYIDADALMEDIEQTVRFSCRDGVPSAEMRGANKVIDRIEVAPTISPDEVRGVGKWISNHDGSWNCSECGLRVLIYAKGNYCPSCGARMTRAEAEKAMEGADTDASA